MKKKTIYLAFLGLTLGGSAYAQDTHVASHTLTVTIPSVSILDIEGTPSALDLKFAAPIEAGLGLANEAIDNSLWLNYTFIGTTEKPSAAVSAKITGTIPYFTIKLAAGAATGTAGAGTKGVPVTNAITLSTTEQQLISGIGSSYTGDGPNNGHQLTYTATLTDQNSFANLTKITNTPVLVTYTILAQ